MTGFPFPARARCSFAPGISNFDSVQFPPDIGRSPFFKIVAAEMAAVKWPVVRSNDDIARLGSQNGPQFKHCDKGLHTVANHTVQADAPAVARGTSSAIVVICALAALATLATNIFLPSLPQLARDLHVSSAA